ncbi:MAG: hypothetical protein IT381_04085 [Deltaproteobacteria bacterium]|nr:hypothetical protein [Deltaproteobacteria bacterium]
MPTQSAGASHPHFPVGRQSAPRGLLAHSPSAAQPQVLLPSHTEPSTVAAQSTHAPPVPPHAAGAVPAMQVPLLQQPPLHGCVASHAVVHTLPLQAWYEPQSVSLLQPQTLPVRQRLPSGELAHAAAAAPSTGHPHFPVRGPDARQPVPFPLVVQSAGALHPQTPPLRHAVPSVLLLQSVQRPPPTPQLAAWVPLAQLPLLQQPPLHFCPGGAHPVVQCAPSQARPALHCDSVVQPQPPLLHRWPSACVVQSRHALPVAPQAVVAAPAAQVPFKQQPPRHGALVLHPVPQAPFRQA